MNITVTQFLLFIGLGWCAGVFTGLPVDYSV